MNARDHARDVGQLIEPDLDAVHPSPTNPRTSFPADALQDLADSITVDGVMQPILVREMPQAMREQLCTRAQLEIVAGERRYRAAILAGRQTIPAILRQLTDEQVIRMQLVENLQREGLNPLEEAEGIARLFATGLSADQIAEQIGKGRSKAYVYAKAKLLALCETVRAALVMGRITESVALLIARLPLEADQIDALKYSTTRDEYTGEPPSVRTVKAHIANSYTKSLSKAPFDPADASLLPTAGTCTACPSRLGNMEGTETANANVCTNRDCYEQKRQAHNIRSLNLPEGTPRIELERAPHNTGKAGPWSWTDYDHAGYRQLSSTHNADPHRRSFAQWLADHGETVPLAVHVDPFSQDAHIIASKADLAAAANRIAARLEAEQATDQAALDVATDQPAPAETAPLAATTTPAPSAERKPIPTQLTVAPRQREHSPLEVAYTLYRTELKDRIRAHPPLLIGGPLLVMIAQAVQGQGLSEPPTESEAVDILIGMAITYAEKWRSISAPLLEQLAAALGIDHAELLAQHVPVPEGCARPNEHGVFEKQHTLSTRGGNAVLLIHRSKTADGWRAEPEFSTPTSAWSGPISLNTPAHEKECQAIEYATREAHQRVERDRDISDKHKKHLLRWLEKLNGEAGGDGIAPPTTQGQSMPYRHPHIPGLAWSGKGKKPQWVSVWLSDGNPLTALEAH